jgi:hypothetical protein
LGRVPVVVASRQKQKKKKEKNDEHIIFFPVFFPAIPVMVAEYQHVGYGYGASLQEQSRKSLAELEKQKPAGVLKKAMIQSRTGSREHHTRTKREIVCSHGISPSFSHRDPQQRSSSRSCRTAEPVTH